MKTKTTLLAIFLTFTNFSLQADVGSSLATEISADVQPDVDPFINSEDVDVSDTTETTQGSEGVKYVSEQNESNTPKKDNSRLYNFLLALTAIAIATAAIILVSKHQGKHSNS